MEMILLRIIMGIISIIIGGVLFLGVLKIGIYIQESIQERIRKNK